MFRAIKECFDLIVDTRITARNLLSTFVSSYHLTYLKVKINDELR